MKRIHKKIAPEFFSEVHKGNKTFELRKDEDNVQVGDIMILTEWDNGYTGNTCICEVTYVLRNVPQYGLALGYCIIGLKKWANEDFRM